MHHAVSHGVDFVIAADAAELRIGEDVENGLDGAFVVHQSEFLYGF